MAEPFGGVIGRTMEESRGWWPALPSARSGSPNVLIVLLDDVGYAQLGPYGSDIATPTFDKLAAHGLRFSNYHTTALCSPTRACLLSGRNHHSNGMGRVVELANGFPGYNSHVPAENGFLSEILRDAGYATFLAGKWHLTPATEMSAGSSRRTWPLGRGFDRYYGFMAGEIDQFHPELVRDNSPAEPPATPSEGYHLTEDLVDNALRYLTDLRGASVDQPFLLWLAPGACHAPHQAPREYIARYRGAFDAGWDSWREGVFARQVASGLLPAGTEVSARPSWVPPWNSLGTDERRLACRLMEAFAGFLTHADAQVGRLVDHLSDTGELDNTVVVLMSDNGASAEGGPTGSFNEQYFFNFVPESLSENLARLDDIGGPRANNHYPWGWAWAGNTPLKRFKRDTHEGGVADPLIIHWPAGLGTAPATRHQYVHAIDLLPTLLEVLAVTPPTTINGVTQSPIEGVSFAGALFDPGVPAAHVTQYYEMLGSRALYHDGWKAVAFHTPPFIAYDGTDTRRPFDADDWELYHVATDFAEVHDLSDAHPGKLAELQALWWDAAQRYNVLPLNNQPGLWGDPRYRRDRYAFYGHAGPLDAGVAPHLHNRSFVITATVRAGRRDGLTGTLVAHGSHAGGYVLYVLDGRAAFTYNFLATELTTVTAEVPLPTTPVDVRIEFTRTGPGGELTLFYGDVPVGTGVVPRTTPLTYGSPGFAVGFLPSGPIDPRLHGRAEITPGTIETVVVEPRGVDPIRDALINPRVELATQ